MCFYNYISILIIIDKTKRKYYQLQFNSSEKVSKKLICNKKNPRFYPRSHSFIFTTKKSQENDDRGSKSQKEEQERRKAGICSKMNNIALTREPTILTTDNLPRIRRKWQRIQVDNQHDNTMYHPWDSCQELVSIDTCYHFPTYSSWSLSHQLV